MKQPHSQCMQLLWLSCHINSIDVIMGLIKIAPELHAGLVSAKGGYGGAAAALCKTARMQQGEWSKGLSKTLGDVISQTQILKKLNVCLICAESVSPHSASARILTMYMSHLSASP